MPYLFIYLFIYLVQRLKILKDAEIRTLILPNLDLDYYPIGRGYNTLTVSPAERVSPTVKKTN